MRESEAYVAKISEEQPWHKDDLALQLLLLPSFSPRQLPEYSAEPSYLSPSHCHKCLAFVEPGCMEEHLRDVHALTLSEYRRKVFEEVLAEWPQRILAQVLRTRLAAFKDALCDEFFLSYLVLRVAG